MKQKTTPESREFARLFARCQGMLSSYILSLVRDPNLAEDILQDVAVNLLEKFEQFDGNNFGGWARTVGRWRVLNHFRAEKRRSKIFKKTTMDLIDQRYQTAESSYEHWETSKSALRHCLQLLNKGLQKVLEMRFGKGVSLKDIGKETGKRRGAIQMAVSRAKDSLSDCVRRKLSAAGGPL